jgi:hypothetical protein
VGRVPQHHGHTAQPPALAPARCPRRILGILSSPHAPRALLLRLPPTQRLLLLPLLAPLPRLLRQVLLQPAAHRGVLLLVTAEAIALQLLLRAAAVAAAGVNGLKPASAPRSNLLALAAAASGSGSARGASASRAAAGGSSLGVAVVRGEQAGSVGSDDVAGALGAGARGIISAATAAAALIAALVAAVVSLWWRLHATEGAAGDASRSVRQARWRAAGLHDTHAHAHAHAHAYACGTSPWRTPAAAVPAAAGTAGAAGATRARRPAPTPGP